MVLVTLELPLNFANNQLVFEFKVAFTSCKLALPEAYKIDVRLCVPKAFVVMFPLSMDILALLAALILYSRLNWLARESVPPFTLSTPEPDKLTLPTTVSTIDDPMFSCEALVPVPPMTKLPFTVQLCCKSFIDPSVIVKPLNPPLGQAVA